MSINDAEQVAALEQALLERARRLAEEQRAHAADQRERMLVRAETRRRERTELAHSAAGQAGEQHYRTRVQATELQLRARLEQLRWTLAESALGALRERLSAIAKTETDYTPLLLHLLREGARAVESDTLVAHLNQRDHARYAEQWPTLIERTVNDKQVTLAREPLSTTGGVLLTNLEDTIRYDNTFEDRLARRRLVLLERIAEKLFAGATHGGRHG